MIYLEEQNNLLFPLKHSYLSPKLQKLNLHTKPFLFRVHSSVRVSKWFTPRLAKLPPISGTLSVNDAKSYFIRLFPRFTCDPSIVKRALLQSEGWLSLKYRLLIGVSSSKNAALETEECFAVLLPVRESMNHFKEWLWQTFKLFSGRFSFSFMVIFISFHIFSD